MVVLINFDISTTKVETLSVDTVFSTDLNIVTKQLLSADIITTHLLELER